MAGLTPVRAQKREVGYRRGAPNARCGVCPNYRLPRACARVEGEIDPDDACDLLGREPETVGDN